MPEQVELGDLLVVGPEQAVQGVERDGRISATTGASPHGQGNETTFAQIVSAVLGIPMEKIRLRTAEPDFDLTANPTGGSRTVHGLGSAMYFASQEIVKNGMALADARAERLPRGAVVALRGSSAKQQQE